MCAFSLHFGSEKMNSDVCEERIIVQDAHCLIQFFARVCDCCGIKNVHKTRSTKKSSKDFKESCEQQSHEKMQEEHYENNTTNLKAC